MEYRKLTHGTEEISIIGLGTSSIGTEIEETVQYALENGINFFDMASADSEPFAAFGREIGRNRKQAYFQIHFGADYTSGKYGWTTDLTTIKRSIDWQLLDAKTSPFHQALTEYQCIQYALDKPSVLTVLPGVRGKADLHRILGFFDATAEERDYSVLGTFAPQDAAGICVYCNHCHPCPVGINIGLINKYYDLALVGDELAKEHYAKLEVKASSCLDCGHCNSRCPFHVDQAKRMKEIATYFGA